MLAVFVLLSGVVILINVWAQAPEEARIVFHSDRDGNFEIYVMGADGSNPINLTNHPAVDKFPAWSPDGEKIAWQSDRDPGGDHEIYVMDADGSNPINLTNDARYDAAPAWSPDGEKIAWHGGGEIYVMDADGRNPINLTNHPGNDAYAYWSPDGEKIVWGSNRDPEMDWSTYVMNADGSNPIRLIHGPAWGPAWSPDGEKILFHSTRKVGNLEIYVVGADGSDWKEVDAIPIRLTNNDAPDYIQDWSPDGEKIIWRSDRDGNAEIYVMDADGSNPINLTNNPALDNAPDWFDPAFVDVNAEGVEPAGKLRSTWGGIKTQ